MKTDHLIRQFTEAPKEDSGNGMNIPKHSTHYHGRPVTELESNFIQPEPKLVIEKESYDMIYKSGYVDCLNQLEKYTKETRIYDLDLMRWIDQQRTTLNKYL